MAQVSYADDGAAAFPATADACHEPAVTGQYRSSVRPAGGGWIARRVKQRHPSSCSGSVGHAQSAVVAAHKLRVCAWVVCVMWCSRGRMLAASSHSTLLQLPPLLVRFVLLSPCEWH